MAQNQRFDQINVEIERTTGVMRENIEKTLNRGDRLEDIEDRAQRLNTSAQTFKKRTAATRRAMCWASYRALLLLFLVLAVSMNVDTSVS
jgi:TolA-binding protein